MQKIIDNGNFTKIYIHQDALARSPAESILCYFRLLDPKRKLKEIQLPEKTNILYDSN